MKVPEETLACRPHPVLWIAGSRWVLREVAGVVLGLTSTMTRGAPCSQLGGRVSVCRAPAVAQDEALPSRGWWRHRVDQREGLQTRGCPPGTEGPGWANHCPSLGSSPTWGGGGEGREGNLHGRRGGQDEGRAGEGWPRDAGTAAAAWGHKAVTARAVLPTSGQCCPPRSPQEAPAQALSTKGSRRSHCLL